ncbi:MAG: cation-translocating P-type ATPase, partial [Euzebyaceae bacterium]|nr:cation-translocating P-type ATPase [Euzebyaceae bacterium]
MTSTTTPPDTSDTPDAPRTLDFEVSGMTCGSCAARVQRVLGRQEGVGDAEVNFATGKARVQAGPGTDVAVLTAAVDRIGYGLAPLAEHTGDEADTGGSDAEAETRRSWLRRLAFAWPLSLVILGLSMFTGDAMMTDARVRWTLFALTTPVQFYVGWPFLREAAKRARRLTANMDTLIALGTLAAYGYSVYALLTGGHDLYFE